jgi:four helix bundle protein
MWNTGRFEDLLVWKKSIISWVEIYNTFSWLKDYDFRNQVQRAVISISNNIAEWFERKTNKELKYFLYISKWSCWEARSMLYLAYKLGYIDKQKKWKFYLNKQKKYQKCYMV